MYAPFIKENANATDRVAWVLCQIIDYDAPMRWTRYRFAVDCITGNPEVMADLQKLAVQRRSSEQVDWRELYRLQTALRYMDNMPHITRAIAYQMADDDIRGLENFNTPEDT